MTDRLQRLFEEICRRPAWSVGVVVLLNLWGLHYYFSGENMWLGQENHDTRVMARHLEHFQDPWRWFYSEWPLLNGFYRPFPTLAFELDLRLWGHNLTQYKLLNWGVSVGNAIALWWFVLELTRRRKLALACAGLFSVWQTDLHLLLPPVYVAAPLAAVVLALLIRRGAPVRRALAMAALTLVIGYEAGLYVATSADLSAQTFGYRATGWPPGRTASIMTLFALISLAGLSRYLRGGSWGSLMIAFGGLLGALMSYEQAVTLAPIWLLCALFMMREAVPANWPRLLMPVVGAFLLTGAYAAFHVLFITDSGDYRAQRSRGAAPGFREIGAWLYPARLDARYTLTAYELGPFILAVSDFWVKLASTVAHAFAYVAAWQRLRLAALGLIGSAVAYAPMAFQLPLVHYMILPAALRTLYVAALAAVWLDWWRDAQTRQRAAATV